MRTILFLALIGGLPLAPVEAARRQVSREGVVRPVADCYPEIDDEPRLDLFRMEVLTDRHGVLASASRKPRPRLFAVFRTRGLDPRSKSLDSSP